ncbi:unnamed protein product [Moneuplotes crassus]|uniref:Uncharacterized protein n=1 Tax=Euplotes crassus TaxID=5936 RepID=A0AAD1Y7R8_EUPCR|nr:unnamed protein product [Moneuplotes crassus]
MGTIGNTIRCQSSFAKRSGSEFINESNSNRSRLDNENQKSYNEYRAKGFPDFIVDMNNYTSKDRRKIPTIFERNIKTSLSKDKRIQLVKNMKDKIFNAKRRKMKINIHRREHRAQLFNAESLRTQTHQYFQNTILTVMARDIALKFELRKLTRERVNKIGKRICWITKSIGHFKLLLKKVRCKIAANKIKFYAKRFVRRWIMKKEQKNARIIYEFLRYTKNNEGKIDLKRMKFYNTMVKVEKRVKQFISRRILRYAILNNRWSTIEAKYFRKGALGITDQFGNYKNIVPYEVRKAYFREYLRYLRIEYLKEYDIWQKYKQDGTLKEYNETVENDDLNSFKQKKIIKKMYKIPEKPFEKTLISIQQMREIVREATDNEHRWEQIAKGEFDTAILKKMKSIKYSFPDK